eukprot:6182967-Pleurochrysis_carterae.AAC.6
MQRGVRAQSTSPSSLAFPSDACTSELRAQSTSLSRAVGFRSDDAPLPALGQVGVRMQEKAMLCGNL